MTLPTFSETANGLLSKESHIRNLEATIRDQRKIMAKQEKVIKDLRASERKRTEDRVKSTRAVVVSL